MILCYPEIFPSRMSHLTKLSRPVFGNCSPRPKGHNNEQPHQPLYQAFRPGAATDRARPQVEGYGLEKTIVELVKIRASQINGCAVCLHMHSKEARKPAKRRSGSSCSMRGAKRRCSARASGPRWPGPKR